MPAMKLKDKVNEWKKRNPIRIWRNGEGVSLRDCAGILGVNTWTLQSWETGSAFPNRENIALLIETTKNENLYTELRDWWKEGPTDAAFKYIPESR